MEFIPANLNLSQLKRKKDISELTFLVGGSNYPDDGRFYVLWKNGNFLVIQGEPFRRPGVKYDSHVPQKNYLEEWRAYSHLLEVIQTMLDTIVFDGEKNWAHLVRQKDSTYRLVYTTKRFVQKCTIWTKVIDLDEIEITRFVGPLQWEGIYQDKEVDLLIGWNEMWGSHVAAEINGQKTMQSAGLGRYTFEFLGPVAQNGIIIGIVSEAAIGRPITRADRAAVFDAITNIQRCGVLLEGLSKYDLYATEHGIKITNIAAAKYYRDLDKLAELAESSHWKTLGKIFDYDMDRVTSLSSSRSMASNFYVIPRLPTPGRPVLLSPEEAVIRWIWSINNSTSHLMEEQMLLDAFDVRNKRDSRVCGRKLLLPDDDTGSQRENTKVVASDKPLTVSRSRQLNLRLHPYSRLTSRRSLLAQE